MAEVRSFQFFCFFFFGGGGLIEGGPTPLIALRQLSMAGCHSLL